MSYENKNTLYVGKVKSATFIDMNATYGVVVLEAPSAVIMQFKDPTTTEFIDEEGEDVHYPTTLHSKASDLKITMGMLGTPTNTTTQIMNFINYLRGQGDNKTELSLGIPWTMQKFPTGCYLKSVSSPEYHCDADGTSYTTMEITFRITDPTKLTALV